MLTKRSAPSYPVSLPVFILFCPLPTNETRQHEAGETPFNPGRKADAGGQDADLHTSVEPAGKVGSERGPAEAPSESLTSKLIVLLGSPAPPSNPSTYC